MTDAESKKLGVTSVRRSFLRDNAPSLQQAINMLTASEEPSPSWTDIVDVEDMVLQDGVLHVRAAIALALPVEHITASIVIK